MNFFTSDTHFGHFNIIRYCKRPFEDVRAMDEAMISRWNAVVGPEDTVWHLGDFCAYRDGRAEEVFWRLNGIKYLVIGNHDEENKVVLDLPWAETPFVHRLQTIEHRRVFMAHYPHVTWPKIGKQAIHLFGHVHGRWPGTRMSTDMGVDVWDFAPVTLDAIQRRLKRNPAVIVSEDAPGEDAETTIGARP